VGKFTKVIDHKYQKIMREIVYAARKEVIVGVLTGAASSEGESIAEYAAHNEYGTENIPSRPFMGTAFDTNINNISKDFNRQGKALVMGEIGSNAALTIIGQKHATRIQNTITNVNFLPKLAPATVKAKKGSTKTLVDDGALVNSIQISIQPRGKSK
jgi:hypothetical protein